MRYIDTEAVSIQVDSWSDSIIEPFHGVEYRDVQVAHIDSIQDHKDCNYTRAWHRRQTKAQNNCHDSSTKRQVNQLTELD